MDDLIIEKYVRDKNIPTGNKNLIVSAEVWAEGKGKEACDLSYNDIINIGKCETIPKIM